MELLPLFPLSLIAFPKEKLNLHIFEPRYRELITECFEKEKTFGIPPFQTNQPLEIGTEMELVEISKVYDDGKMDIKTKGIRTFKIHEFYSKVSGKLYPGGEVEFIPQESEKSNILQFQQVMTMVEELYGIMDLDQPVPEWDVEFSIYEIAHKLGLSFDQEMALLKTTSEAARMSFIQKHLEQFLPKVKEMMALKARVQMNGHFKNAIPPDFA